MFLSTSGSPALRKHREWGYGAPAVRRPCACGAIEFLRIAGLRNIHLNATIHGLLGGEERIGVKLTDASELSPTGTTGAVCSFHPEARYT